MRTFSTYISEKAIQDNPALAKIEDSKLLVKHAGIEAYLSPHSYSREMERSIPHDTLVELTKKALDYTADHQANVSKSDEVLFYSKSLNQAMIASYRRSNPRVKEKYLFIVTVLPYGKSRPKAGTEKFVLEHLTNENPDSKIGTIEVLLLD